MPFYYRLTLMKFLIPLQYGTEQNREKTHYVTSPALI
jgi:hypothetical protein